jgi:hypothetical protein
MSNKTQPDKRAAFPVYENPDDYKLGFADARGRRNLDNSGLRKISGVDGQVKTLIERLQPYHKHATGAGLLLLDRLWRVDKHLVPLTARGDGVVNAMGAAMWKNVAEPIFEAAHDFPYEDDATVATQCGGGRTRSTGH